MESSLLACPICTQPGFLNVDSLCHCLIHASTREFLCPVCNDVLRGLDKFTIHLFSHSILHGQHTKGAQPSNSKEVQSVLSSNVAEPLSLKKKPLIICDSFAEFHVSTPIHENSLQYKAEERAPSTCNVHNLRIEPSDHVSEVSAVFDAGRTAVDHAEVGSTSESIENSLDENSCTMISNSEMGTKEISEADASSTITQGFQQNLFSLGPPETERACADEIALETTSNELSTERHGSNGIKSQIKSSGHCNNCTAVCDICQFSFTEDTILEMHKQLIHSDLRPRSSDSVVESDNADASNARNYPCLLCSKSFRMRGSLMVHVRVAHNGFPAGRLKTFNQRELSAQDDRSYSCNICDKSFKKENHLTQHMKTHDGKQWACDVCSKLFTTKYFLKKHKRLHTGKCFRQRVSYLVHRRIHTGVMPYKCTACGKSFRYKVSQRTHKCPSQPPGTVVRQSSDLVQKLRQAVEIKPLQGKHIVSNGVLTADVKDSCSILEKRHIWNKEAELIEKQQSNECVILANSHIQSTLSHDIPLDSSPILWLTGEVEKSLTKAAGLGALHMPQIIGLCDSQQQQQQQVQKDCNDETLTRNYPLKFSADNKIMGKKEMFYEAICKDEKDTTFVDQNKTADATTTEMCNTKLEIKPNTSQNKGMICPSTESSDILNIVMTFQSQSDDSKKPAVFHETNEPVTLNVPILFNTNAESVYLPHKQNILTGCSSEKSDLGSKSGECIDNTCGATVSQSIFIQESGSGTREKSKYLLPSQQMLMLSEESLNLFYDTDI